MESKKFNVRYAWNGMHYEIDVHGFDVSEVFDNMQSVFRSSNMKNAYVIAIDEVR